MTTSPSLNISQCGRAVGRGGAITLVAASRAGDFSGPEGSSIVRGYAGIERFLAFALGVV